MKILKKFDEITREEIELYRLREIILSDMVNDFFQKNKNKKNILSADEVYSKKNNFLRLFYPSIWTHKFSYTGLNDIIFGLKSGIVFYQDRFCFYYGKGERDEWVVNYLHINNSLKFDGNKIIYTFEDRSLYGNRFLLKEKNMLSCQEDIVVLKDFLNSLNNLKLKFNREIEKEILAQKKAVQNQTEKLAINKKNSLSTFDLDGDGKIDLINNDFNKLFLKNQKQIMGMDKNYVHQFVKVSNYIKTKQQNTQKIYESLKDTSKQEELDERIGLLKNQIHSYELLVFHSINMIGALVSEDLITFYEIYESFDKLGMFNSNWENEVSEKLTNIGDKLDDLMYSIYNMEQNIVGELSQLGYITQESFEDLNRSVTNQLREVESSINFNSLLTGIQTYQLYKINKNTKGLRK